MFVFLFYIKRGGGSPNSMPWDVRFLKKMRYLNGFGIG